MPEKMTPTRDAKLVQYLNEAYGKEKQLETALEAHIAMTTRQPYKRRLQEHLKETKGHARVVERRIKQLGGTAEEMHVPGPDLVSEAASKVTEVAHRGVALAQGPLHMVRGTGGRRSSSRTPRASSPMRPRRSRTTPRSRPSPTVSATARPRRLPAASAVRRSACPASSRS